MNISLTPELENFIQEKVTTGYYSSVSEVIRESLRLMITHDDLQRNRIKQLNQAIDAGLDDLQSGNTIDADTAYEQLKKQLKNKKK
jgi:antitoxin ParD1/3/4